MATVKIYQFTKYDIATDINRKSRRWGTCEAIEWLGGTALENTAVEVDASVVRSDVEGLTEIGFNPHALRGPQTQVQ